MKQEIRITQDGSATLYVPELDEHYHSTYGAVQESMHVFISAGLLSLPAKELHLLEIGFGTGLNAMLSFRHKNESTKLFYETLELYPIPLKQLDALNYSGFLKFTGEEQRVYNLMHTCEWNEPIRLDEDFTLLKRNISLTDAVFSNHYDLVYFDAFAPQVQPELWAEAIFATICKAMNPGAVLVTYCAKGEVRRCLQRCGLTVERIPGPPGKREMLRACKKRM